jgi:ribosomal protein L19
MQRISGFNHLLFVKHLKNTLYRFTLVAVTLLGSLSVASAQSGLKGFITDNNGEPLPFATIYIKQTETGTTTNIDGFYSMKLNPGSYAIVFQYLGYAAIERSVIVGNTMSELNIQLQPESLVLRAVEINAKMEDPAYTVMRKAIAKSKFHTQQLDEYSANVYIKGSGRLVDSPFFLRKTLAKEGIDSSFTFVSESISEISYKRPNTFTERVISVRTNGDDNNTSPNAYIMGSFYEPEIAEAISPLSPKAFGYYRFEYLGTFTDRDYAISKIRVTPRSRGDDVFEGVINIVEDYWSIYSLDLTTTKLGIKFNIKQIYNPINEIVWLPVSHQFAIEGTFLGFDFEYDYLATASNYDITLNPDLAVELTVIDEKVEKELAKELESMPKEEARTAQEELASGKEVTRKELRKLINEYEKQELEELEEPKIVENYSYSIDSTAANSDSAFWVTVRPVPLSVREQIGYKKMDSIAVVEKQRDEGDTLKSGRRKGFHIEDILFGNSYRFKQNGDLRYYSPFESLNFNSVEGYNFNIRFRYSKSWDKVGRLDIQPLIRYSFSRGRITGKLAAKYYYNVKPLRRSYIELSGGKFVQQINPDDPIHPLVNSITTLLFKSNYMKIYESGFIKAELSSKLLDNLGYTIGVTWSERKNLNNTTNHTWIKNDQEYTSNNPTNVELIDTSFPFHKSLVAEFSADYRPWQRYRIRYGRKFAISSSSPTFLLTYRNGIKTDISDTDFDYLEVGFKHKFRIGARGRLGFDLAAGKFLNDKNLYFMDFKHFMGNESPFLLDNPVGGYRLLSYYNYSTSREFFSGISYYQFRKFLFTQLPVLRLTGVKEMVFLSYLATPFSENYFELGYGIDNLFRIFRVEGAVAFQDYRYAGFGVKVGIATSISSDGNSLSFGF